MTAPFNRRDSTWTAVAAGLFAGVVAVIAAPGTLALGIASAALTILVLGVLLRTLPPDLPLHPLSDAAARAAIAPPPPGVARLRVAMLPETLSWSRLDLYLDGVRVAQLRPGTATVVPMRPGAHVLTLRVWLRRLRAREMIIALPGTDWDLAVSASGGKSRHYAIERRDLVAVLAGHRVVLVGPAYLRGPMRHGS